MRFLLYFLQLMSQIESAASASSSSAMPPTSSSIEFEPNENSPPTSSEVASDMIRGQVKQSRRLPYWLWVIIAKSLGIKLHPKDRPVVSSVLHILTLGCGAGGLELYNAIWLYDLIEFLFLFKYAMYKN